MDTGCWGMAPSTLAQWAGAVGTTAAVIVALFKDSIRGWWNKPQLKVTCSKEAPWTVKVPITAWQGKWPGGGGGHWKGDSYFVRVKVENKGRSRAEKVQVSALKVAKLGADGKYADIQTTLPFNMRWSNGPPASPVTVLDGISREMSAFCDIVSLCDPGNPYQRRPTSTPAGVTVGQLQLEFDLADEWHLLAPGAYLLILRIAAANVEPIDGAVAFTHTGTWTPDEVEMRRDSLAISVVKF
jgi:hypothetical protein